MNIVIIMVLVPLPPMNTIYLMLVRIVYIIIMVGICFLFFDRYAKYMMLALHIPIMDSYTPLLYRPDSHVVKNAWTGIQDCCIN